MSKQTDLINIPDAITVSGSNVGIGSSPSSSSTVKIQNTNDTTHNTLDLFNDNGNRTFTFQQDSTGNAKVILQKNDGTNAVRLDANLGGILFGTDTAAANALDDYEEGTWTPSIAGNATYTARTGQYVKVGRLVTASFDMTINAINSSGSSSSINGLPFTAGGSTQGQAGSVSYWSGAASSITYIAVRADVGSGSLGLSFTTSAVSTAQLSISFWQNAARMIGTLTYVTA